MESEKSCKDFALCDFLICGIFPAKLIQEFMSNCVSQIDLDLPDEQASEALGQNMAKAVLTCSNLIRQKGLNIRLDGDLGAGKTFLTRALLRAMGFSGRVKSPTFTLLETYPLGDLQLNHFDFYRFESPEEFEEAGFRDAFGPGLITAVEWAAKAGDFLPPVDLVVSLKTAGEGRTAQISAFTETARQLLVGMQQ